MPASLRLLLALFALALVGFATLGHERSPAVATPVAASNTAYSVCGRVFPDPHAYWPSPMQAPERSPFAKGNATCAAVEFMTFDEMIAGMTYMEGLFPDFIEFYDLERDFGGGADCDTSVDPQAYCSAGLPRQGVSKERVRSELFMIRVTDERVPDDDKRFFVYPLSIHGIERAGAEAGVRAAEDLATWAYCEAIAAGETLSGPTGPADGASVNCA